jgi:LysR family nod box-dependent transcriptional activator
MRFDNLDLNLLVVLDALVELKSVSATARKLHLSQPAISGALARLRIYFDDQLLITVGRHMVATPKAEALARSTRQALTLVRAEITCPGEFDPATAQRHFSVLASDYIHDILLADVMAEVASAAPGVTFDLVHPSGAMLERFLRAEIDLFFTIEQRRAPDHPQMLLIVDQEAVICAANSRHANGVDATAFMEAGHAVTVFGDEQQLAEADAHLLREGVHRRVEVRAPGFSALPNVVIGTDRLAIMHRKHAERFARTLPIHVHPVPLETPAIHEIVQWHRTREQDEGVRWLLEVISRHAARIGGPLPGTQVSERPLDSAPA